MCLPPPLACISQLWSSWGPWVEGGRVTRRKEPWSSHPMWMAAHGGTSIALSPWRSIIGNSHLPIHWIVPKCFLKWLFILTQAGHEHSCCSPFLPSVGIDTLKCFGQENCVSYDFIKEDEPLFIFELLFVKCLLKRSFIPFSIWLSVFSYWFLEVLYIFWILVF